MHSLNGAVSFIPQILPFTQHDPMSAEIQELDESEIQIPPEGYEIVSNPGNPQSPRPGPSSAKDY